MAVRFGSTPLSHYQLLTSGNSTSMIQTRPAKQQWWCSTMGLAAANGMQKGKHCAQNVQSSFKASQLMLTEVVVLSFNHLHVWGIVAVIEWGIPIHPPSGGFHHNPGWTKWCALCAMVETQSMADGFLESSHYINLGFLVWGMLICINYRYIIPTKGGMTISVYGHCVSV